VALLQEVLGKEFIVLIRTLLYFSFLILGSIFTCLLIDCFFSIVLGENYLRNVKWLWEHPFRLVSICLIGSVLGAIVDSFFKRSKIVKTIDNGKQINNGEKDIR
jgi:hypothetical protein